MKRYYAELTTLFETVIVMRGPNGEILSEVTVPMRPGIYTMHSKAKRDDWISLINAEAGRQIARVA